MRRLHNSIASINNDCLEDIELCTLLTTVAENLHAVSHFRHETALQYSQDFGIITKESSKTVTKWAAKYFTQEKFLLACHLHQHGVASVNFMRPPPSEEINSEIESGMKEFVKKCRRLRQRTVWEETYKGKAGALPPAVYTEQQDSTKVDLSTGLGNDFNSGDQPERLSSGKGAVQATSESGNVTNVTFVDDCIVQVTVADICRRTWHRPRKRLSWPGGWRYYPNYGF